MLQTLRANTEHVQVFRVQAIAASTALRLPASSWLLGKAGFSICGAHPPFPP